MFPSTPLESAAQIAAAHDIRAVHDCASLPWSTFLDKEAIWHIVDLRPAASSGSTTIPGAHIQVETGDLVNPSGAAPHTLKEGAWKVLRSATPVNPAGGTYSWAEPDEITRSLTPEQFYSPFIRGGVILTIHAEGAASPSPAHHFEPALLLPEGFIAQAADAFNPENTAGLRSGASPAALTAMLRQPNGLLAVHALQLLLAEGALSEVALDQVVAQAGGYRLAMMVYVMLMSSREHQPLADRALEKLARERNPEKTRMMLLGTLSALYLGRDADPQFIQRWMEVSRVVAKPAGNDPTLEAMYELLGSATGRE